MKILVIDDEQSFFEAISGELPTHTIDFARSYETLQSRRPEQIRAYDLIVCDNDFDGELDAGLRIISFLRSQMKFTNRIILHTGNPRSYFHGDCDIKRLNVDHVQKPRPYTTAPLLAAIFKAA